MQRGADKRCDALFGHDLNKLLGNRLFKSKDLRNTNLVASRHIKKEKSSLPVDVRLSKTSPLKLLLRKRYLTKRTFFSLKNGGNYEKGELHKRLFRVTLILHRFFNPL